MHEERCLKAQEEADNKIRLTEQECAKLIGERRMAAQAIVDQLALDAEEERKKYLSIVATIANTQPEPTHLGIVATRYAPSCTASWVVVTRPVGV